MISKLQRNNFINNKSLEKIQWANKSMSKKSYRNSSPTIVVVVQKLFLIFYLFL